MGGLFQESEEVRVLMFRPGHGLQCGGLSGVICDRGFVEDVYVAVGCCGCSSSRTSGTGGWPFLARAPSVSVYLRIRVRPGLALFPRIPMAQDYEDSPRPTAATSPHDSTTRTHAHANTHAHSHRPACGVWGQRCTHTQL